MVSTTYINLSSIRRLRIVLVGVWREYQLANEKLAICWDVNATITEWAFNKCELLTIFECRLNSLQNHSVLLTVFFWWYLHMMLDPIFAKVIGHSALHSVAFGGVKVYVGWLTRIGTHNHGWHLHHTKVHLILNSDANPSSGSDKRWRAKREIYHQPNFPAPLQTRHVACLLALQDISAITSSYTLINMYLFQFDYKKGQKTGFHIK